MDIPGMTWSLLSFNLEKFKKLIAKKCTIITLKKLIFIPCKLLNYVFNQTIFAYMGFT